MDAQGMQLWCVEFSGRRTSCRKKFSVLLTTECRVVMSAEMASSALMLRARYEASF